jgi:hypothetical protein
MVRALVQVMVLVVVLAVLMAAQAAPWLNWLTPNTNRHKLGGSGRSGRDRFRSICRTINPDNYAFPGRVPYPSAPLCPY